MAGDVSAPCGNFAVGNPMAGDEGYKTIYVETKWQKLQNINILLLF
jgi:hypothetical protein